jgi:hypothetical protein
MSKRLTVAICFLTALAWNIRAAVQGTGDEIRPEIGLYIQQGPQLRLEFVDSFNGDLGTHDWKGNFDFYVETALKPVLRRELRDRPDVFRNKYLTFRAGYRYQTSLTNGQSATENRGILEVASRHQLPWQLVVADRNRGEFRFIQGKPFAARYRNRLRLERDLKHGWLDCTPYIYDEIFYDARYDRWTPNRYGFGVEFPINQHVVLEPYYFRQHGSRSNPPNQNVFGFKFNLYF